MNKVCVYFSVLGCVLGILGLAHLSAGTEQRSPDGYGPNLYWPGDFEHRFEGGIFGSQTNLHITAAPGRCSESKKVWKIVSGYQHLELLVPSYCKGKITFWAFASYPQTLIFKVVDPLPPEVASPGNETRTLDQNHIIEASGEWKFYQIEFETLGSWPKPPVSEILLCFFHEGNGDVLIDDLEVRMAPVQRVVEGLIPDVLPISADAFAGTLFGSKGDGQGVTNFAENSIDATSLRGKRIRISANVTYLSMSGNIQHWGSILFLLKSTDPADGEILQPEGDWPFWAPIGHASPPGEPRRIHAVFQVPEEIAGLQLIIQAQQGIGSNLARVDGLNFEILN